MRLWAIVPVKPGDAGKSRLAGLLDLEERRRLCDRMLGVVLAAVDRSDAVEGLIIVGTSIEDAGVCHKPVRCFTESGGGLNLAVRRGLEEAQRVEAEAALVLPADLPLVDADDVDGIARLADFRSGVVIAPSRRQDGTNGLLLRPPGVLDPEFGPDSFRRHVAQAELRGLPIRVYQSPRIGLDVDLPSDLLDLGRIDGGLIGRENESSRVGVVSPRDRSGREESRGKAS